MNTNKETSKTLTTLNSRYIKLAVKEWDIRDSRQCHLKGIHPSYMGDLEYLLASKRKQVESLQERQTAISIEIDKIFVELAPCEADAEKWNDLFVTGKNEHNEYFHWHNM